jgi:microsomal epoxide hydrolase
MKNSTSRLLLLLAAAQLLLAAPPVKSGWFVTSDSVRLDYREAGTGPPIVFVPGWTMPGEIWERQIRHFSEQYHVVALDPRSQGESERPSEGHYPERRARDIKELVDSLKLAPAVLVGWSMGVPELLTYVDQFGTSTVRALVLVDGVIGADPGMSNASLLEFLRAIQTGRTQFAERFVRSMYKQPQPEEYLKRITSLSLRTPTNTAALLIANMFLRGDWRSVLPKLDRPVLYTYTPELEQHARNLKAKVPSARLEVFPDAGHALFVDDAGKFNQVLDEFLNTVPSK